MNNPLNNDRLITIETALAMQEDLVQTLNDVVANQQRQIDRLEQTCKLLVNRMRDISDSAENSTAADELPPHY